MSTVDHLAGRGLDAEGYIRREGSISRIAPAFADLVAEARDQLSATYGERMHSAYLYGSIPRGTATEGRSDLDLTVLLHEQPTPADDAAARHIEAAIDATYPCIDGVGILVLSVDRTLSPAERYDLAFHVVCLCTPLLGPDLADQLPRYRPTSRLARDTNGDVAEAVARFRARLDAATSPADITRLCRNTARKLTRTAFTLVMPRWQGWTSDLDAIAQIVATYYPAKAAVLRTAARLARDPRDDGAAVGHLLDELGDWLVTEYADVIGLKPSTS